MIFYIGLSFKTLLPPQRSWYFATLTLKKLLWLISIHQFTGFLINRYPSGRTQHGEKTPKRRGSPSNCSIKMLVIKADLKLHSLLKWVWCRHILMKNSPRYLTVAAVCQRKVCHVVHAKRHSRSWEVKGKKWAPNPEKYPLVCLFSQQRTFLAANPIRLWYPGEFRLKNQCIAPYFFFFLSFFFPDVQTAPSITSTHLQQCDYPSGRWDCSSASKQKQQAARAVSCGTQLVSEACGSIAAGTEGRRGRSSDSLPFVKGRELAVSPWQFPRALYFAGFSISNNERAPAIVPEQSGESISGEAPAAEGQLASNVQEERTRAASLFHTQGTGESFVFISGLSQRIRLANGRTSSPPKKKKERNYVRWDAQFTLSGGQERWQAAAAPKWLSAIWAWFAKRSAWGKTDKNLITRAN